MADLPYLRTRDQYSGPELPSQLWLAAAVPVLNLGLIPNDFYFVHDPWVLGGLIAGRGLLVLLALRLLVVGLGNGLVGPFHRLGALLCVLGALQTMAVTLTRPVDYLIGVVPILVVMVYLLFILPAPAAARSGSAAALGLFEVVRNLFFRDQVPLPYRWNIVLAMVLVAVGGLTFVRMQRRIQKIELEFRRSVQDEIHFRKAMADAGFDAMAVVRDGAFVDGNHAFWKLTGLRPSALRSKPWAEVFTADEGGDPGRLHGNLGTADGPLPVEIEVRRFPTLDADVLVIRDRSVEAAGLLGNQEGWKDRVDALPLSARERDIVRALIEGWSRSVTADRLFISEETVKTHIGNIYRKLGVASKAALFRLLADPTEAGAAPGRPGR